jgi:hypothetical protein
MFRVSPDELRSYLDLPDADTLNAQLFLEMGNSIVEDDLVGSGLSTSRLKVIELNLAAHFAVLSKEKGGITRQRVGESEEGYRQDFSSRPNLSSTRFGQTAVSLDTTGVLASLDAPGGKAEFRVM